MFAMPGWRIVAPAVAILFVSACARSGPSRGATFNAADAAPTPKRVVASIQADPHAFSDKIARATTAGAVRGGPELEWLLNSGLTVVYDHGLLQGQIAEVAPTTDNGLWV